MKPSLNKYCHCTDLDLIHLISEDEMGSFEELYNRYWKKLYLYGHKMFRDEEICQDIVQEVFLDIWRRRHKLNIQHVSSFMYQMVKYQIAKHLRKTKIRKSYLETMQKVNLVCRIYEQVEFNELNDFLIGAMEQLPSKCKQVFYLSRYEHLSNKEIASRMNIAVSTVEKHINKALKILRVSIKDFQD